MTAKDNASEIYHNISQLMKKCENEGKTNTEMLASLGLYIADASILLGLTKKEFLQLMEDFYKNAHEEFGDLKPIGDLN